MNGDQLRDARARLGLTQAGLADLIGTTGNTIARWERNEVPINEMAARFIAHLAKEHVPKRRATTRGKR